MTATQMKRIRRNLARSAELTDAAYVAARDGHADYSLRELCARASSDAAAALRQLEMWEAQVRANAEEIARNL